MRYSYSWLEPRVGLFDSEFKGCFKVVHVVITLPAQFSQFVYFDLRIFLQAVVWHWLSIHVVTVSCLFDSYAICLKTSESQSANWIKVVIICDNEAFSQSCLIIIVIKKVFLYFNMKKMSLQDFDSAPTSVIVWPNYMISEHHTQIVLKKMIDITYTTCVENQ